MERLPGRRQRQASAQARKRVSADVIVRDSSGRILLVDPTCKPDWDLPGGMAEANEPPADAVRRELREELGLDIQVGDLVCVDWVSPHGPWDDLLDFIFDGGTLNASEIAGLQLVDMLADSRPVQQCLARRPLGSASLAIGSP
jgi:8-oxo-dGTP diphosphatase